MTLLLEGMFPATARAELGVEAQQAAQLAQRGAAREVSQRVELAAGTVDVQAAGMKAVIGVELAVREALKVMT